MRTDSRDGVEVVRAAGEVDTSNAHELEAALSTLAGARVVVDLTDVEYIDSAGVQALDRALIDLSAREGAFRLVAPAGRPARLTLRVSGYDEGAIAEDLPSALAALEL